MTTYTVTFTVKTKRSLGVAGECELESIVEDLLDGMRDGGLPKKYDATNINVDMVS